MIHFRNKNDIIDWLEKNCPRRAITRALREGQVELLGGFACVLPTGSMPLAGWIIRIISIYDKTWNVIITAERKPQIRILRNVPWAQWVGDCSNVCIAGDNPDQYRKYKDEAKRMATR